MIGESIVEKRGEATYYFNAELETQVYSKRTIWRPKGRLAPYSRLWLTRLQELTGKELLGSKEEARDIHIMQLMNEGAFGITGFHHYGAQEQASPFRLVAERIATLVRSRFALVVRLEDEVEIRKRIEGGEPIAVCSEDTWMAEAMLSNYAIRATVTPVPAVSEWQMREYPKDWDAAAVIMETGKTAERYGLVSMGYEQPVELCGVWAEVA